MEHDPDYRAWVDGMCLGRCPGGESKAEYVRPGDRGVCPADETGAGGTVEGLRDRSHGGTQMALLEQFAVEKRDYYAWQLPCGHGYRLDASQWQSRHCLKVLGQTNYTGGEA